MSQPVRFFPPTAAAPQVPSIGLTEPLRAAMTASPEQYLIWEEREMRRAYNRAVMAAKAELAELKIERDQQGDGYRFADLASVIKTVTPVLNKNYLAFRYQTQSTADLVTVTCILFHVDGHEEDGSSLSAPPDNDPSMTPPQRVGSTTSYLQRYTLLAALGIAVAKDTDAGGGRTKSNGGDDGILSGEQLSKLLAALEDANIALDRLLRFYKINRLIELPESKFKEAMTHIAIIKSRTNGGAVK